MMDMAERFIAHYKKLNPTGLYPDEMVRKTFLGRYPNLIRHTARDGNDGVIGEGGSEYRYAGNLLDLGFGDARNMVFFRDLGYAVHGVEIHQDLCQAPLSLLKRYDCHPVLKVGCNTDIPFEDDFFDCVYAGSSFYYLKTLETSFSENIRELKRVLKPNGWFVASFPTKKMQKYGRDYFAETEEIRPGHLIIRNAPTDTHNGSLFRVFSNREELTKEFSADFYDISIGECDCDFYGNRIAYYMLSCYLGPSPVDRNTHESHGG